MDVAQQRNQGNDAVHPMKISRKYEDISMSSYGTVLYGTIRTHTCSPASRPIPGTVTLPTNRRGSPQRSLPDLASDSSLIRARTSPYQPVPASPATFDFCLSLALFLLLSSISLPAVVVFCWPWVSTPYCLCSPGWSSFRSLAHVLCTSHFHSLSLHSTEALRRVEFTLPFRPQRSGIKGLGVHTHVDLSSWASSLSLLCSTDLQLRLELQLVYATSCHLLNWFDSTSLNSPLLTRDYGTRARACARRPP